MNKQCFKTVFSKRLGCLVAVGEHTASQGKANGAGQAGGVGLVQFVGLLAAGFASVSLAWAQPASNALPTGGVVAQGAASISTSGAVMNIQQSTPKAVLNWQSFDIGSAARVNIVQPGADAVMLNRVTGANPSQIFGQLSANGQVVLVNPNGVLFGKDGSVSASSFTASTLGISDANFMAGNMLFERNGSTAGVLNQGSIKTSGGYVALLGASVSNEGRIETNGGAALLGAAETVKVPLGSSGRIKLELSPSAINAAVSNSKEGTIVTHGGQVYMQAAALNTAVASIIQSGSIDTTAEQGGAVHVLADGGQIKVDGSITANSTGKDEQQQLRKGGDIIIGRDEETGVLARATDVSGARLESQRGFVETSAHDLMIDGVRVKADSWLLDPDNIDITGDATAATTGHSKIKASDIVAALNQGTSVTISTTAGVAPGTIGYSASNPGDGNIRVSAPIAANIASGTTVTLSLVADNGITIASSGGISDTAGSGILNIDLNANGNAASATNSAGIVMANGSSIDANGGLVTLNGTSKFQTGGFNKGGLYMFAGTSIKGGSVRIDAKTLGTTGGTAYGAFFDHKTTITATAGDIDVTGTLTGAAAGNALFSGSNPGGGVGLTWSATGKVNISGDLTGSTNASSVAVQLGSMRINAGGDVDITAKTPNAGAGAIIMQYAGTGWNPAIKSGGNISILTNQGAIALNNFDTANTSTGLGITGNSLTIDNTGGQWVNGVYTKGAGYSTSTSWSGVQLNGVAGSVVVTGNVNIFGNSQSSGGNAGVNISAGLKGAAVSVDGTANTGNGIYSGQTIESTSGDVKMTGVSGTSSALSLQGAITASNNVEITGTNTDPNNASTVAYLTKAVTASNGTLRITADTAGSATQALNLNGATLTTTSGKDVTLTTDSINLAGNISAGAGTVTIQNKNAGVKIDLGGADVGSATATSRTLGLNVTELGKISAAKTVLGSATAGNLTVSSAVTSADAVGHLSLVSGADLAVNAALQVGTSGTKTLTLAAGANIADGASGSIKAGQLELLGSNAAVTLDGASNQVGILAANVRSLNYIGNSELTIGAVNSTTGIRSKEGMAVVTTSGNLNVNQAINNSSSGDVVLGAGVSRLAGDSTGGDIKTSAGATVTNGGAGTTRLYTGSTTGTGALSSLDSSLVNLFLSAVGSQQQNADTHAAYGASMTGGAPVQVFFREKVSFAETTFTGATLGKTYGDGATANTPTASDSLLAEMRNALKATNTDSVSTQTAAGTLQISRAALIDDMGGASLTNAAFNSTSTFLKANATAYTYGAMTGSKYGASVAAGDAKVTVAKRALTGTITQGETTYGDALVAGAQVALTNKVGNDDLVTGSVSITTTGKTSTSGHLKAGLHTGIQTLSGLTGADADNYTFSDVKGDYKVNQRILTGVTIDAAGSIYGDTVGAGAVNFSGSNLVQGDKVGGTATVDSTAANLSSSSNLKAGNYTQTVSTLTSGNTNNDADNYSFAGATTSSANYAVSKRVLTGVTIDAAGSIYGDTVGAGAVNFSGSNLVQGDKVGGTVAVVSTNADLSSSGRLSAGSYRQSLGSLSSTNGNNDADNYSFAGTTTASANYVVKQRELSPQITGVSTTYGTAAATGAVTLGGVIAGDKVNVAAPATLVDAAYSSSGNLKAGSYQQTVGSSLSGTDAKNYTASATTVANYVVTPKAISATVTAADKVYDGNNIATLQATSADILAGDQVNVTGLSGTFASKNVARDAAGNVIAQGVTVSGAAAGLAGNDGGNYILVNASNVAGVTARITPKDLTVSGITASDKVYDGTTTATLQTGTAVLSGLINGDSVNVSAQSITGNFASKNVALDGAGAVSSQMVNVTGVRLSGSDAGNYNLSGQSSAQAKILQRALTLTGTVAQDKNYDGNTTATVVPGQLNNLVTGESLSVSASGTFADAEVGSNKVVNATYRLANGANGLASNYTLINASEVLRAAILSANRNPLSPIITPGGGGGGTRVVISGSGSSGAAVGVADDDISNRQECSVLHPEKCECEESTIPGIEMCYAPNVALNNKD